MRYLLELSFASHMRVYSSRGNDISGHEIKSESEWPKQLGSFSCERAYLLEITESIRLMLLPHLCEPFKYPHLPSPTADILQP